MGESQTLSEFLNYVYEKELERMQDSIDNSSDNKEISAAYHYLFNSGNTKGFYYIFCRRNKDKGFAVFAGNGHCPNTVYNIINMVRSVA